MPLPILSQARPGEPGATRPEGSLAEPGASWRTSAEVHRRPGSFDQGDQGAQGSGGGGCGMCKNSMG